MTWALLLAGVVVAVLLARKRCAGATPEAFDPERELRKLEGLVLKAGTEPAAERGWDEETLENSMAQALGLLTQGLLNACGALGVSEPRLAPYSLRTLELAKLPMLSTTNGIYVRLSRMGVVPSDHRPHEECGFETEMAQRIADAPTRAAKGMTPFRVDSRRRGE